MARKATQAAPAAEVELEQVKTGGIGIDEGIALTTFFVLVGAIALIMIAMQEYPALGA